jgi:hypothetical protein
MVILSSRSGGHATEGVTGDIEKCECLDYFVSFEGLREYRAGKSIPSEGGREEWGPKGAQ